MIPLTKPYLDETDFAALEAASRQGAIAQGPLTSRFESLFAERFGFAGAVATNSCTSALVLALRVLGVGSGYEVILPSYTCLAVLNAVIQAGGRPVLVDNLYVPTAMNYNLDPEEVRAKLSPRTAAVIVPHMFGVPANVEAIVALGIPVVEDTTLSLGARCHGQAVGHFGAISVCSLHASKMIACGEGGILASTRPELVARARYLNGWEGEQTDLRVRRDALPPYELRYNFHLSGIAAALGISQLDKLEAFIARRRALAIHYTRRLASLPRACYPDPDGNNLFFRYLVSLVDLDPVDAVSYLAAAGIEAGRGVFPPLHRYLGEAPLLYPGAERASSNLLSLPLYPALAEEEVEVILHAACGLLGGL